MPCDHQCTWIASRSQEGWHENRSGMSSIRVMVALCTVILVTAALFFASPIVEPVAFALFFTALVYPFQKMLQKKIPKQAALGVVLLITLVGVARRFCTRLPGDLA